jgi:hypothetical protein
MEEDIIETLNIEMKKVTTMLEFLIVQPSLLTKMIDIEREKIMVQNLLRVKCCGVWADKMLEQVESKCSEESIKAMNDLFKMVEVNKSKRKL